MDLALPWTHLADTLFKSFNVSICDDFRAVIFPCPGLHLPPSLPHSALPRCVIQYPSKMQGGLAERGGEGGEDDEAGSMAFISGGGETGLGYSPLGVNSHAGRQKKKCLFRSPLLSLLH